MLRTFDLTDDHSLGPTTLKLIGVVLNFKLFRRGKVVCLVSYEWFCRFLVNSSLRAERWGESLYCKGACLLLCTVHANLGF